MRTTLWFCTLSTISQTVPFWNITADVLIVLRTRSADGGKPLLPLYYITLSKSFYYSRNLVVKPINSLTFELKLNCVFCILFSSEKTQSDESAVDESKYLNCDFETWIIHNEAYITTHRDCHQLVQNDINSDKFSSIRSMSGMLKTMSLVVLKFLASGSSVRFRVIRTQRYILKMLVLWPLVLFDFRAFFGRVTWLSLFWLFLDLLLAEMCNTEGTDMYMLTAFSCRWWMAFYGRLGMIEVWNVLRAVVPLLEADQTHFLGQGNSFYRCGLKKWQAFVLMLNMFKTQWKQLNCSMNAKLALKGSTKRILFAGPVRPVVQIYNCPFHWPYI